MDAHLRQAFVRPVSGSDHANSLRLLYMAGLVSLLWRRSREGTFSEINELFCSDDLLCRLIVIQSWASIVVSYIPALLSLNQIAVEVRRHAAGLGKPLAKSRDNRVDCGLRRHGHRAQAHGPS
jgi:hypothetical protein